MSRQGRTVDLAVDLAAASHPDAVMRGWARRGVYIAGGILFAAGLGMSLVYQADLANEFSIGYPWAFLLPIALDCGALIGLFMWLGANTASSALERLGLQKAPKEIETFGRQSSRLFFTLSIIGNGLERFVTFVPRPAGAQPSIPDLLLRVSGLVKNLIAWTDPIVTVTTWLLLAISVGIGIVFPLLAYRMGHAVLLGVRAAEIEPTLLATATTPPATRKAPAATVEPQRQQPPAPSVPVVRPTPSTPPQRPAVEAPTGAHAAPEPAAAVTAALPGAVVDDEQTQAIAVAYMVRTPAAGRRLLQSHLKQRGVTITDHAMKTVHPTVKQIAEQVTPAVAGLDHLELPELERAVARVLAGQPDSVAA